MISLSKMIFLTKSTGFEAKFDNSTSELTTDSTVSYQKKFTGNMDYVRKCMINRSLDVPDIMYWAYADFKSTTDKPLMPNKYQYDILVMPPNVAGIEYAKTHGNRPNSPIAIEFLYGAGAIMLQKLSDSFDDPLSPESEVTETILIRAQKGERVFVPKDYYYTVINTRSNFLIAGRLHLRWDKACERENIKNRNGFAYYIIRKNARQELVKNPRYRNTLPIIRMKASDNWGTTQIRSQKPLINILENFPDKFKFLSAR